MELNEKLLGRGESLASKICGGIINCVLILLVLALLAVLIVTNMFALCRVDGASMNPTLTSGQFVLVEKHKSEIKRGDVIVFKKNDHPKQYIKRTMGLAGDEIEFVSEGDNVYLYVNGEKNPDDFPMNKKEYWDKYDRDIALKLNTKYTVPDGKLFVLGDNRNDSMDSRYTAIGFVDVETELLGRADVFLEQDSFTEWLVEMIYGVPFKEEYNNA